MRIPKKMKKSNLYMALLFLVLFVVYQYGIVQIYGMVEYPDEFGYWSNAANIIGWDWSQIASRGSYYSFGYSLILFPILKFCEDAISAYRMAVTINFMLIVFSFFLLKGVYQRIFTEQVEGEMILSIGMAMLYPAWLFYSQTSLVDSLLIFMVILICYLWVRFIQVPRIIWGIALMLAVIYGYSLHMRFAGILVAYLIAMVLWMRIKPCNRKYLLLLSAAVGLWILMEYGKEIAQKSVFANAGQELLAVNDYGGQISKIIFLFQSEGIQQLLFVTMGKVLYLGLSSGGLVYAAIVWCVKQMLLYWKKKSACGQREWLGIFFLLIILGQSAVCVIYTIRSENADWLIYGRYIECFVPMAIFLGVSYLFESAKGTKTRLWILFAVIETAAALCCIYKVWNQEETYIRGEHSVATVFLTKAESVNPRIFFTGVWITSLLLLVLLQVILEWFRKERFQMVIFAAVFSGMVLWQFQAAKVYIYQANRYMSGERILVSAIKEQRQEGKKICYLEEGNRDWISNVQMQLREEKIYVISIRELKKMKPGEIVVLVDGESKYLEYMSQNYNIKITGNYHYLFYEK